MPEVPHIDGYKAFFDVGPPRPPCRSGDPEWLQRKWKDGPWCSVEDPCFSCRMSGPHPSGTKAYDVSRGSQSVLQSLWVVQVAVVGDPLCALLAEQRL